MTIEAEPPRAAEAQNIREVRAAAANRVRAAVAEGYEVVAVARGDGTVRSLAFELLGTSTALGIRPAGTAMNVARSLGIPRELDAAAAVLANNEFGRSTSNASAIDRSSRWPRSASTPTCSRLPRKWRAGGLARSSASFAS